MREILFKAKRLDNGEWVEGYYFAQGNGCDSLLSYIKRVADTVHVDPSTVCEFTGLLDRNGKKIFEGDKVIYYQVKQRLEPTDDPIPCKITKRDEDGNWLQYKDYKTIRRRGNIVIEMPYGVLLSGLIGDYKWWKFIEGNRLLRVEVDGNIHDENKGGE